MAAPILPNPMKPISIDFSAFFRPALRHHPNTSVRSSRDTGGSKETRQIARSRLRNGAMSITDGASGYSTDSMECGPALRSQIIRSSRDCGWTSVLLDHHRVEPTYDAFETRPTPDQTIVVMLSGTQTIEAFGSGSWRAAPYHAGTVGMTPGGVVDRLRRRWRRGQTGFEKANLYVPQSLIQEALEQYRRAGQVNAERSLQSLAFQDPLILQTVLSLLRGMQIGLPDIYAQTATCWLVTHLLSAHSGWTVETRQASALSQTRLDAVRDLVSARFAEPLTLDDLAAEAGISKFHFARLFRQSTGTTPHVFVLQVRLEAACRLLTETNLRIKQIAAQTGFQTVTSLGAALVREHGVTPSAYRRRAWE